MIVYAVDPGAMTGICKFNSLYRTWHAKALPALQAMEWIDKNVTHDPNAFLVCERFIFTSVKHTRQNDALEVIGVCRYIAHLCSVPFELQNRSDRVKVPIKLAREIGSFESAKITDHELDAVRHAVVAVVRHGGVEYVPSYTPA